MRPFQSPGERQWTIGLWAVAGGLAILVIVLLLSKDDGGDESDEVAATSPATTTIVVTTTSSTTTTTLAPTTTIAATTTFAPTTTLAPTTTEVPTTTTEPPTTTTEPATTTTIPGPTNVAATGTIDFSSEHPSALYPSVLGIDGRRDTSWVSAGDADLSCVGLTCTEPRSSISWLSPGVQPMLISEIRILNSSQNPDPVAGPGFGSVIVFVYNDDPLHPIFQQEFDLNGPGPDPDLVVPLNIVGDGIALSFHFHDDPAAGGFSELEIIAVPA